LSYPFAILDNENRSNIPNGLSESLNRRTDNAMAKKNLKAYLQKYIQSKKNINNMSMCKKR
jgi:hypothetical protein